MAIKLTMKPNGGVTATAITKRMSQAETEFKVKYPTAETRYVPKNANGHKMIGVFVGDEMFGFARTRAAAYKNSIDIAAVPHGESLPENYCELHCVHHTNGKCPENKKWGKRSLDTLNWFAHQGGGEWIHGAKSLSKDMIEQNMSDLLSNFAHLCDIKGVRFGDVLRRAKGHYDAETTNRGQQSFEPQY